MRILVTNHWLRKLGGSETFTYTMVEELVRLGHEVDVYTNEPGMVSDRMKQDFKIKIQGKGDYDLILASHNSTIPINKNKSFIIQTCHGIYPKLEQPAPGVNAYVAISFEVQEHLKQLKCNSTVIWNGINLDRFRVKNPILSTQPRILSLAHSDTANNIIKEACRLSGSQYMEVNKYKKQIWKIEDLINDSDLVVSLGRGAYEAMACGRNVLVFDARKYMPSCGDGLMIAGYVRAAMRNNCTGRRFNISFNSETLANEIMKYAPVHGSYLRWFAENNLDIRSQVQKYLQIYESRN